MSNFKNCKSGLPVLVLIPVDVDVVVVEVVLVVAVDALPPVAPLVLVVVVVELDAVDAIFDLDLVFLSNSGSGLYVFINDWIETDSPQIITKFLVICKVVVTRNTEMRSKYL